MNERVQQLFFCTLIFLVPFLANAQSGSTLPVASTHTVVGMSASEGEVVVYDKGRDVYAVARERDGLVFGVTALAPALVFSTASDTVPIVEEGFALLRVDPSGGVIKRGDVLTASAKKGYAERARKEDINVFAIALEDYQAGMTALQAEINQEKAKQLQRQNIETPETTATSSVAEIKKTLSSGFVRSVIATCIAVGALLFVLYSFRSTIGKAVVSIGRNPRARGSIMMLSFGNIIFALILCAVALFVAIAVLVLPL